MTWKFTSLDPITGKPPEDPLAGFLPPGGGGSAFFTVMPKTTLQTGTQIRNAASIVFDTNAPIVTPEWLNTIDNTRPTSSVLPFAATQTSSPFLVRWSGADVGAGVEDFTIYVSDNGAPFTAVLTRTTATQATFTGVEGHTYGFYSIARDLTGNVENSKTIPEASTRVVGSPLVISGMPTAPCTLWPPNGKLVRIATLTAVAGGSGLASFEVTGTSNEPQSNSKEPDIVISGTGLGPRIVELRADRLGNGTGRIYSIIANATDTAGSKVTATFTCTVPHDQGKK